MKRAVVLSRNRSLTLRLLPIFLLIFLFLVACSEAAKPTLEQNVSLPAQGEAVFNRHCTPCHSLEPDTKIVGPSLAGVATRAQTRMAGLSAPEYIHLSITKPSAYVVDGFNDLMPSNFVKTISGEDLDALIAFLLTLE